MKFPDKFYLAILSSYKGRARGALLDEPTWMCGTGKGFCHWSTREDEKTIFLAKGNPDRFILKIYKSFQDRQKGSLKGHHCWVYNAGNTSFNYTSVEREATMFKLLPVPVERGAGYQFEILKSYENRAKGTDKGHRTWLYNDCKILEEGIEGAFGYTSVENEATVFAIREFEEPATEPTHVVDISFDLGKKVTKEKPCMLYQATYVNKSDIELTMSTKQSKETKKTRVFEWSPSSVQVGASHTIFCEVPFATMSGEVGFEDSSTFSMGKENGEENSEVQKWILPSPAAIPPRNSFTIAASVTQGRLEVPFVATMQNGSRQWKEGGMLYSTNCFGLRVDCFGGHQQ